MKFGFVFEVNNLSSYTKNCDHMLDTFTGPEKNLKRIVGL